MRSDPELAELAEEEIEVANVRLAELENTLMAQLVLRIRQFSNSLSVLTPSCRPLAARTIGPAKLR